jgi:methylmalonyl-CoA mutase
MEIAKLRAARLLWSRMVEQYKASARDSYRLFIHSTTASWNMSLYDPFVNMLRTTTEGMSAALGNADSVSINPYDTPFKDSDDFSRRVARNQQLVLKEESYLDKIVDPAAGSYYIENLTHSIAHHAWDLFKTVEARGGMIECIKDGFIQDEIARSRNQKEADIAQRKIIMLGTNQYPNPLESMLDHVKETGAPAANEPTAYKKITPFRITSSFEEVRLATEKHVKQGKKRPAVFLLTIGNLAMLRARAGFVSNFFGCAGYEIMDNPGFSTTEEGIAAAIASKAEIVVICSSDEEYPTFVPEIAEKIKAGDRHIKLVVAGYPKDFIDVFKSAGVDQFIHVRTNLLETLQSFQKELGIS